MNSFQGKLSTLTSITNIGHGFFKCRSIQAAAMYISVQSRSIVPFERSIVISQNKILAISGQSEISQGSKLDKDIKELFQVLRKNVHPSIHDGFLANTSLLHIPLKCPTSNISWHWFIEINDPQKYQVAAELLGQYFSEGLLHLYRQNRLRQSLKPLLSLPLLISVSFILACIYCKVPEKVIAPLIVKATHSQSARAATHGLVLNCLAEGTTVKKGTTLAELDVSEFEHQLKGTLKSLTELTFKVHKASKDSLKDNSKLIEIELLKNEQDKLKIKLEYLQGKISRNKILASIDGVIRYLPEVSRTGDNNTGRFLQQGEILCYIDDLHERVAEVSLAESHIHTLQNMTDLYLYYHTAPNTTVHSEVVHIPDRPEINTLTQKYVYLLQAKSDQPVGVTGTAHIRGQKVKLGYYLFKKIYFYLRGF